MKADARKAEWTLTRRKAWSGFTGLSNRMIDSEAFQAIRSVHAVKVLIYFWQMAVYAKEKRRPGQDSPVGNLKKITNWNDLSFTYLVARYRGMLPKQFSQALRELHQHGFIDIIHHGRGIKGDWTKFAYSDRWKLYGTTQWEELRFPDSIRVGWRQNKRNFPIGKLSTTQKGSYRIEKNGPPLPNREVKNANFDQLVTSQSGSPSRSYHALQPSLSDERQGHKPWRPPRSELRESVTEILRQRPDDRASDRRFVAMLVDTLDGAGRERLDPARVYRDLQDRHGLDKWHADLLFAVACIPTPEVRT